MTGRRSPFKVTSGQTATSAAARPPRQRRRVQVAAGGQMGHGWGRRLGLVVVRGGMVLLLAQDGGRTHRVGLGAARLLHIVLGVALGVVALLLGARAVGVNAKLFQRPLQTVVLVAQLPENSSMKINRGSTR